MTREYFRHFRGCKRILDIGPSIGLFMSCAPKRIVGVDINPRVVAHLRKQGYQAVKGTASKLPFKDASFDGVMCSHVIEHLYPEEARRMIQEADRVLKKDGIFMIRTPHFRNAQQFYHHFGHIKPYFPASIRMLLEQYADGGVGTEQEIRTTLRIEKVIYDFRWPFWLMGLYERFTPGHPVHADAKAPKHEFRESKLFRFAFDVSHVLAKLPILRDGHTIIMRKG